MWTDWTQGQCSHSCGEGLRENTRTKITQEQHGGECLGNDKEQETCNSTPCTGKLLIL